MPLFTVADARAFEYQGRKQLADAAKYPNATIEDTAARIAEDFARICDVAFVPTASTATLDGTGHDCLGLPGERIIGVEAVERWDGAAWVADSTGYRLIDDGVLLAAGRWATGRANLRVTYTHGYAEPPEAVKRAALILATNEIVGSNVSDRATQQTNEFGTYNLAVAGWREGQWYGLPPVDSVLARYSARRPRVG